MLIVCEICKNKEVEYLPYPIKNEIYLKLICFFCKEEINICSLCTKYIYKKDKDDDLEFFMSFLSVISHTH